MVARAFSYIVSHVRVRRVTSSFSSPVTRRRGGRRALWVRRLLLRVICLLNTSWCPRRRSRCKLFLHLGLRLVFLRRTIVYSLDDCLRGYGGLCNPLFRFCRHPFLADPIALRRQRLCFASVSVRCVFHLMPYFRAVFAALFGVLRCLRVVSINKCGRETDIDVQPSWNSNRKNRGAFD